MAGTEPPEIELSLLDGFRFSCRPDCGLCCFAEPRIDASEVRRLLQIAPEARLVGRGSDRFLAAHPNGGACQFLSANRCRVHEARPHPCREFPITVHMGYRLQATIVLSCPGIDLGPLLTRRDGSTTVDFEGLDAEVRSVRARIDSTTRHRIEAAGRRGRRLERALRAEGRWDDDESVRARFRSRLPRPSTKDFPVEDPPELSEGWERLPLFFDGRSAPLALARQIGGWEVWQLAPDGGGETLGVYPPPERPPSLEPRAERLLDSYLRYVIERDAFLASAHLDALEAEDGTVAEWAEIELGALGAMVLARGAVRAKIRGTGQHVLAERDVADGIRATDMDWLDRPTWGDRL